MKNKILIIISSILIIILLINLSPYSYIIPGVFKIYGTGHSTAFLEDYTFFENRIVKASKEPKPWPLHNLYNAIELTDTLNIVHKDYKTVAFIIIKNDSIFHESYYNGYTEKSKSNSFSMAKSMITAMLGKAIKDGKISSLNQKVGDYFIEFTEGKAKQLTVGDLSSMSSGLDWEEKYYNPLNVTTEAYFTKDLKKLLLSRKIIDFPGKQYKYLSGNTQLLAMVISKAVGMNLTDYFSEKFWQPINAVEDAFWQIDSKKNGMEKAYCCFASNAKDFARFGKLFKDYGQWENNQIIDSSFVSLAINPRFQKSPEYGYGWWLSKYKNKSLFAMRGHLGQYVIVIPKDNLIIVRLGHKSGKDTDGDGFEQLFYTYINETYKMIDGHY